MEMQYQQPNCEKPSRSDGDPEIARRATLSRHDALREVPRRLSNIYVGAGSSIMSEALSIKGAVRTRIDQTWGNPESVRWQHAGAGRMGERLLDRRGAAGALIGLQFVVMTLIAERPPVRALALDKRADFARGHAV